MNDQNNMNRRKNVIVKKCKKIKLVLTDVDGVLTDGGLYYSNNGDVMKKFHVRDGMGVTLLRKNKIHTVIITKEKTKIVKQWANKMKVKKLYDGIIHKELILYKIHKIFKIKNSEIAYIGDDVNDLELMKRVGFTATPRDGIDQAKRLADYVCKSRSGDGVFREIADLILSTKFPHKKNQY
jgi:YrbI family 3-deoxy-D-manno-octulosonate 8-phosphate phosphatase